MKLKILLPARTLVDEAVTQVSAETADGYFTIRPRHVDFTTTIVPGILSFRPQEGEAMAYVAVDTGILVKESDTILVSTRKGTRGEDLEHLKQTVADHFRQRNERERQMHMALARMESSFFQRFIEMSEERT